MDFFLKTPKREYLILYLIAIGFLIDWFFPQYWFMLLTAASFGAYPILVNAFTSILRWQLTIDVFNLFALIFVFSTGDIHSAAFIVLMLAFTRLSKWRTSTRSKDAVEELLKHRPKTAFRENGTIVDEINIARVRKGDILTVKAGEQIPVDGTVVFGKTKVDELFITGESVPVEKNTNDEVLASTVNLTNPVKICATNVGKDTTLEKMASLMEQGYKKMSKVQKLANVFASYFFPIVLICGLGIYLVTQDLAMTAAFFLVACADDITVAIPLAITATFSQAAKKGVLIKNGKILSCISGAHAIVFNKTNTLTYGDFVLKDVYIEDGIGKDAFWQAIAVAEKYSEHPMGKTLFREALEHMIIVPNAQKYQVYKGSGVYARYGKDDVVLGNEKVLKDYSISFPRGMKKRIQEKYRDSAQTIVYVAINSIFVGYAVILDTPREEMRKSILKLKELGIGRIVMLTGDKEPSAAHIAGVLGIEEYRAELTQEEKLTYVKMLKETGKVIVIGDGINDAPTLAHADVGIAMGKGGSAIASKTADIVILNDNLAKLPFIVELTRKTSSVIYTDIGIWFATNTIGFSLVFIGIFTPALAAFYNMITNFFPILNSTRLFAERKIKDIL